MPKVIAWNYRLPCQRTGSRSCCDAWLDRHAGADLVGSDAGLRRGLDGLSAIVQQNLGHSPCAGSAFIFRNRAGNRLRLLLWDGNGVWLCQRRLHQGSFIWPKADDQVFAISQSQWQWLIAGVDWQRLSAKCQPDWQV